VKFKRQREEDIFINVTSLLDVVLIVLIFFIATTTFNDETRLKVTLPEASIDQKESEIDAIELVVNMQGEYFVNGKALINNQVLTVKRALQDASGGDNHKTLIITADANARHAAVVRAMDAAGQLGFEHLSMTTIPSTEP
jgi:biopolymer transport protein ExbD